MATALPRQTKSKAGQSGRVVPLQAVQREDSAAMESLMAGDVDVNAVTSTGMTPLISAAANGHLGTVRALLNRGAAVNQKRKDGFTALALAAFFGHEQVVRELLCHGADVKAEDKSGTSAEMWAEARNLVRISDLLREIRERSPEMASPKTVPVSEPILSRHSPQPSPAHKDNEDVDETTIIRQRTKPIEAKTVAEVPDEAGFPEGSIRRVGVKSATTAPMIGLEDRVDNVAAFSPFSALVDRLTASWKHVAFVTLVLMLLSGVVTFAALKAIGRKAKPNADRAIAGTSDLPAESGQPASLPNQPASSLPDPQTKTSLEVSTGQVSADAIQHRSSDHATTPRASHSMPTVSRDLASRRAAGSETKRRAEKPKSQYSNRLVREVAKSPHTTHRRSESMRSDSDGDRNGSIAANEPAAIKIVSEPPAKQVRKANPAKEIQAQPTAPLEGPSAKRKVIQWP